jgi:hypothetical protein
MRPPGRDEQVIDVAASRYAGTTTGQAQERGEGHDLEQRRLAEEA